MNKCTVKIRIWDEEIEEKKWMRRGLGEEIKKGLKNKGSQSSISPSIPVHPHAAAAFTPSASYRPKAHKPDANVELGLEGADGTATSGKAKSPAFLKPEIAPRSRVAKKDELHTEEAGRGVGQTDTRSLKVLDARTRPKTRRKPSSAHAGPPAAPHHSASPSPKRDRRTCSTPWSASAQNQGNYDEPAKPEDVGVSINSSITPAAARLPPSSAFVASQPRQDAAPSHGDAGPPSHLARALRCAALHYVGVGDGEAAYVASPASDTSDEAAFALGDLRRIATSLPAEMDQLCWSCHRRMAELGRERVFALGQGGLPSGISEMPEISGINELTYGSNGIPLAILNEKWYYISSF
ncbi:hypothetical protein C8J57DRAFT_1257772 [Mycena rebaudengoi]|nr:hypothetical protein C8J57DRAFT_1257772 [Mycena rebaudengoi]